METFGQKAAANPVRPLANIKRLLGNWGPVVLLTLGSLWLIQGVLARTVSHGVFMQGADYDAGTVKAGAVVTHSIRLINLSDLPMMVDAQPSCGCTIVDVPTRPLGPLRSEVIKTQIDTDGLAKGRQLKGVVLRLHSGNTTWHEITYMHFQLRS